MLNHLNLLSQVGGTLHQAVNAQDLKWSSRDLDADDAHVVRFKPESLTPARPWPWPWP